MKYTRKFKYTLTKNNFYALLIVTARWCDEWDWLTELRHLTITSRDLEFGSSKPIPGHRLSGIYKLNNSILKIGNLKTQRIDRFCISDDINVVKSWKNLKHAAC